MNLFTFNLAILSLTQIPGTNSQEGFREKNDIALRAYTLENGFW